jgi:NADPH:quinone reductase-like Zn-dependent oxidoreductase
VPGHELSGLVVELGYGTTGLTVGQRAFGLTDWTRDGSLAEYTAVEARNLAPFRRTSTTRWPLLFRSKG